MQQRHSDDPMAGGTADNITERKRAEEAVGPSEEQYRALFTTIDQGFCIIEKVATASDQPSDFRYLEANPAFERHTGMHDVVGKTIRESVPDAEQRILDIYDEVVRTGQQQRFVDYVTALDLWMEAEVLPTKTPGQIAVLFSNVSERMRTERALRRAAALDAFRVTLNDALRPLSDAVEIQAVASRLLGEHLGVDRVAYAEVLAGGERLAVARDWTREGVTSVVGRYRVEDFGPFLADKLRNRQLAVIEDAASEAGLAPEDYERTWKAMDVRATISHPIVKGGQLTAVFFIHAARPRRWSASEVSLVTETAERTWDAVERARAEAALRDSEARLHVAVGAAELGTFVWYVTEDRTEADARALAHFGLPPDAEATLAESLATIFHPEDGPRYVQAIERASDPAGPGTLYEEFRIRRPDGQERWMAVSAITAFEGTPPVAVRMTGVLADVTERKRHEANLALLAELSEDFARLASEAEIMQSIGERLAKFLRLDGYNFADVDEERESVTVTYSWTATDVPSITGIFRFAEYFTQDFAGAMRAGATWVVRDVRTDPRCDAEAILARGIGAYIVIPYHLRGEWIGCFTATFRAARDWTEDEIALVREVSNRTFPRLERARAEQALRDSEARFRTLADAVPQVIWANDAEGHAIYFNQRWYAYSGLSYEQSAGPGWQVIVHPDDAPASVERWQHALAAGQVFDTEYRLRRADGVYRWHLGRNVPLRDEGGRITGWFGSATDIEELKQAEAARRESDERFRLLVEGARDYAMFLMDPDHRITFWSAGAERVFGWSEAEVLGQRGDIIFTPNDRSSGEVEREVRTALREGRAVDRRWHVRKDGTRLFLDGVLIRLDDEEGRLRGFVKIGRDATAQREAEEEVQRARDELELRVQERTAELLQLSSQRQQLLQRLVTAQEDERRRIARELHDSLGQYLSALTLDLARLQAVEDCPPAVRANLARLQALTAEIDAELDQLTMELRPPALDALGLADALARYVREWSASSGIGAEVVATGCNTTRLPIAVEATAYRIAQEALTNVRKHAQAHQVSAIVECGADTLRMIIEDDGVGFDVEAVRQKRRGGRQLGLVGMAERAALVGGTLTIESEPGAGTTVYMHIPLGDMRQERPEETDV